MRTIHRKSILSFAAATLMAGLLAAGATFAAEMKVKLSGDQEVPPVQTQASGNGTITVNEDMSVSGSVTTTGIKATAAHIHEAAAGKNGPPVIWLSPKGSPVQAPVKGEATLTPEQAQQFSAGEWYINVHTQDHQPGEIRGQVMPPKS